MANPNDTSTQLGTGTGGDLIDESRGVRDDGSTVVKRPRVVLMFDDGTFVDDDNPMPVALAGPDRALLTEMRDLLRTLVACNGGLS